MDEDRLIAAFGRIDRALGRIEAAAQARLAPDSELARRHARLREATRDAIAELDLMIGAR